MKIVHISDLHIGRRLNGYSLYEDQEFILNELLEGIRQEKPQTVLIAGDVYDKSVPTAEAVKLLDKFLDDLHFDGMAVMLISGNHDSADRLSFGSERLKKSGLYIQGGFNGAPKPVTLQDESGKVNFYLLPYTRIADINAFYETDFTDYTEAFSYVVERMNLNTSERNVLIAHQYVAGAEFAESESMIGGVDFISADVFEPFDYTALGHIHRPQNVRGNRLRYCGTPLKYNYSEIKQPKSYTVIELGEKKTGESLCQLTEKYVTLTPKRELREIKGSFDELMTAPCDEEGIVSEDYIYAILTDKYDVPDALSYLRKHYPNMLNVQMEKDYSGNDSSAVLSGGGIDRDPMELFEEFYALQNNGEQMDDESAAIMQGLIDEIWGEEE